MANNQQSRTALTGAGARSVPASADRGGYYQLKTKEEQLAYIEKQLQAGESARQNRQTRRQADDSGYYDLETKEEQIAYIENQLKTGAQRRQVRQEANARKASGKVHQGAAANEPVATAQKGGKAPYDMTAPAAAAKANANYWEETVRQAVRQPDKDSAFQAFNTYMEANPAAKELWELEERGAGKANALGVAAGARSLADASGLSDQQEARRQELRRDMTEQERATYETMRDLYDSYGELWSLGKRAGEDAAGLGKQAAGSFLTLGETAVQSAKDTVQRTESPEGAALRNAQKKMDELFAQGRAYTVNENGIEHPTAEYTAAVQARDAAEAALNERHPGTILTPKNSTGVRLYQEGGENLANAQMGLSDGAKFTMNTANAIAGNAPAMATALIPVVGPGLSLGLTGAQAAGGRAAELSAQGEKAGTALARGLVSGGIEAATEILPVGSWVDIIKNPGGKSALRSILQQMGSEATEESVSYLANYLADLAAQDPNAQFSLEELAENALMGGISGGVYGGVGVGANRILNRSANDIPSAKSQQQADMVDAEQGDGLRDPAQGAEPAQEAGNAQAPSVTYEQGMANELDRLFGLQSNANQEPAKAFQRQEGNATAQNDAGVSTAEQSATEWNRKAAARMAEQAGLPEDATLRMAQDYNGTANPAVYAKAWADMYDAGRTGSLTEEQVLRAAGSAAAVTNQAEAMHNAYLLGAEEAGHVMVSPAGNAERGATVEYEGGNAIGTLPDELLQAVAARYGVDVDVVNQLAGPDGSAANGKWAAAMARITLGENSGNSYQTLQHELTHYIDSVNPEGWARLKNRILEYAARSGMENVSDLSRQYENSYEGAAVAADEMARDILAGVMSSEENVQAFCEHVASDAATNVQEKRSILQALRDMLDRVIESLRRMMRGGDANSGSEYGRRLAEVQDSRALVETYLAELDAAAEVRRGDVQKDGQQNAPAASVGAESYSIQKDESGMSFVEIDDDILEGVEPKDILKTVRSEIRRRFPDGFVRNGWKIELNSQGVKEFTRSKSSQTLQANRPAIFRDKMRMAANLDEIIQTAEQWRKEQPKHPRNDSIREFNRADVRIRVAGNDYTAEIVTGIKPSQKEIFYDIVGIRPTTIRTPTAIQDGVEDTLTPAGASRGSSKENISQLQQKVNDVAEASNKEKRQRSNSENQFSRVGETDARRDFARENRELARRNMQLEEQLQTLKEEFRLSEGHRVDPKRVRQLARQLVREYESRYDAAQLEGELTRYFEYIANDPDANYADAMDTAQQLMRGVLEQSSRANTELRDAYKPVRDDLRAMSIEVQRNSPAYYELLNEYGDGPGGMRWGNVRRNTFGRVNLKLVDGPGNWDTQFAELAQSHPAVFDEGAGIAENVAQALRVFEASEVSYDNPYGLDLDTAAENAAQELFEAYMDMPERHTYADRQQQKTMELKAEYRRRREAALERQKAGYEKRLETVRQSNEKRLQGLRSQNAEKLVKQQAMFDQRMANRNEGLRWRQARDQAEKNMKRLYRWVSQPTNTQNVPENMRQAVLQLLDAFDWNTRKPGSKANADMRTALLDIQRMISDPDPSGDSLEYADFDPDLRQEIDDFIAGAEKDAEGRVQIGDAKKFSAMQMQQLNGILTSVTHSITNANKLLAQERNAQLSDVAGKSVEEIHARSDERARERHPWMRKLLDTNIGETAESLTGLDMMDAGSYFRSLGPAAEKIYRAVRKGFDTRTFKIREGQEFMQTLLRGINLADWSGGKAEKSGFTTEGGQKLELTPGQVMELYCLTQRQQAHLHLVQGGIQLELRPGKLGERVHLTATDISNIVASLTPEQVRVAKEMQKYLSTTVAGWGNETSMELYGIRKFREKNYWPIKTSDNFNRTTDANTGDPGLWGIKNAGMTKATKIKANNPLVLRDAFDTWYNHVAQMASYNGWAVPLSDMMKWYNWHDQNNVSVKEAIESLYGSKGKNYFTTLMKDLNGMSDRPSRTGLDKALGSLTRPWKVAKVGANLRVVIQQPTSYLRAAAVIDPKYLTRALSQAPAHLKEGIRNAEKYSAISQWARWGYFETNLGQSMRSVMIGDQTAAERLQELATAPAGAMDRMTRGTLWLACEDEVRATRPELQGEALMRAVADRLDEVIDRTQVVDTVLSRSHLMRSKNALTQMAMNFMAEPTKTWNMMREAAVEMARTKPNSKGRSAATKRMARVTATWLVTALGTAAAASIIDSWRVKDDDKDKEWLERYAQALRDNFIDNVNLLGSLPLVKDIMSIAEGYDIERTDMAAFADMMDSMSLLAKTLQGKGNATPYDLIRALSEPVSALTGIPVSNAQRELKSMYDMLTNLQDPLRLDRSLFADPEAVSYTDMVGQIRAEGGSLSQLKRLYGTNGSGNATYTEMLGGEQAEKVDAWLEKLSADTGTDEQPNTSVLPKRVSNKISWTQDGQEMVEYLSGPEYLEYAQTVQSTASRLIADYMDKAGKEADAKQRAEFVEQVKTYAVETARAKSLTDYQPEDWVADIDASGGNVVDQIVARQIISGAESDRDVDGNAVSGSKAKNAVQELVDQGYSVAEARAMYERQENKGESQYLELYEDVSSNSRQADELAALFGADGTEATYAGMLGKGNAKKVDSYLQDLARTAGDDVLPDYLAPLFTYTRDGESQKVELNGREYVEYAGQRTETAYDLLELFLPDAKSLPTDTQADVVRSVESYATQTAKAEVSDFEPDSWVRKVQAQAGNDPDQVYALLLARQLIWSAEGQKDANGKTISGSKKAAALQSLQDAGYNQAYAQELYKLFG